MKHSKVDRSSKVSFRDKLQLRASYALSGSAAACVYPFMSIWLSRHGFSVKQIGVVGTLKQISILIGVPLWCLIIDKLTLSLSNTNDTNSKIYKKYKRIISIGVAFFAAMSYLLFLHIDNSFCIQFLVLIFLSQSLQETVTSLLDSLTLHLIENSTDYGKYRLFAGISWACITFTLGYAFESAESAESVESVNTIDTTNIDIGIENNNMVFVSIDKMWIYCAFFLFCMSILWTINHVTSTINTIEKHDHVTCDLNDDSGKYIKKKELGFVSKLGLFFQRLNRFKLMIILAFYIMGIAYGVKNTFLHLYLIELGGTTKLTGTTTIFTTLSEAPCFYFGDKVYNKIGETGMILIGFIAYAIRLGFYSILDTFNNPWYVLFAEMLHGMTFAWIWQCVTTFAYRLVNNENDRKHCIVSHSNGSDNDDMCDDTETSELRELSTFTHGFLSSIFNGFGPATGALIGGFIYSRFGAKFLFALTALSMTPCIAFFIHLRCMRSNKY